MRVSAVSAEVEGLTTATDFHIFHPVDAFHHGYCVNSEQLPVAVIFASLNDDVTR